MDNLPKQLQYQNPTIILNLTHSNRAYYRQWHEMISKGIAITV